MKKFLSILLALAMVLSMAYADNVQNPFSDVPETAWYHNDVVAAVSLGLINGKTPTLFAPNDNLTYAEAIKLAACMNQYSKEGKVTLKNGNPWYQTYVDYCVENKIISKMYNYNENATRAGYIEIFANALTDEALKAVNKISDGMIPDVPMSAPYAKSVYKMYRAGILQGVDLDYNCSPNANIKRGEVATILVRMMNEGRRVKFELSAPNSDDSDDVEQDHTKQNPEETEDDPIIVPTEDPQIVVKEPTQTVDPAPSVTPTKPVEGTQPIVQDTPLTIHKQPVGSDCEAYGSKYELEVQVFGGKAPYTYEWQYKERRDAVTIKNGDDAKDAESAALILSIEKDNTLLGKGIYCVITDAAGAKVTTDSVKVYGPFSMPVDDWTLESGKNTLIGRVADGILKKGEKVSVIRDGKVIAIGVAQDLQMFNKSMDETVKGDYIGIVFNRESGVTPSKGDLVVKYQPSHVVDTSDIVN